MAAKKKPYKLTVSMVGRVLRAAMHRPASSSGSMIRGAPTHRSGYVLWASPDVPGVVMVSYEPARHPGAELLRESERFNRARYAEALAPHYHVEPHTGADGHERLTVRAKPEEK